MIEQQRRCYGTESRDDWNSIDWERALILFCERLKELKRTYGPESVAFLSTGQIVTEEMAFLGALFKFGHGPFTLRQQHPTMHGDFACCL